MLKKQRKLLGDLGFITAGLCIVVLFGTYVAISAVIHGILAALSIEIAQ